jgi:hypothetical protein
MDGNPQLGPESLQSFPSSAPTIHPPSALSPTPATRSSLRRSYHSPPPDAPTVERSCSATRSWPFFRSSCNTGSSVRVYSCEFGGFRVDGCGGGDRQNGESRGQSEGDGGGYRGIEAGDAHSLRGLTMSLFAMAGWRPEGETGGCTTGA